MSEFMAYAGFVVSIAADCFLAAFVLTVLSGAGAGGRPRTSDMLICLACLAAGVILVWSAISNAPFAVSLEAKL